MPATTHIQAADLMQYVCGRADQGSASHIRSHVLECTECESRLIDEVVTQLAELGSAQQYYNSRETRVPSIGSASLQTLSPLSFEKITVQIVDASKNGYGLLTNSLVEPGTIVHLSGGAATAIGTVRYCRSLGHGQYKTGIQTVAPGSR